MLEVAAPQSAPIAPPAVASASAEHHMSFRDVLSALNPLQYLPVIGTIYRAITGDQIPEPLRRLGSIIAGGLLGGPIGAAMSVAMIGAEKATGIDLDQTGQELLNGRAAEMPVITDMPTTQANSNPVQTAPGAAQPPAVQVTSQAWSPAQLAAYRVRTDTDGTLRLGNLTGADVLNTLELSRLSLARSAYTQALGLAG